MLFELTYTFHCTAVYPCSAANLPSPPNKCHEQKERKKEKIGEKEAEGEEISFLVKIHEVASVTYSWRALLDHCTHDCRRWLKLCCIRNSLTITTTTTIAAFISILNATTMSHTHHTHDGTPTNVDGTAGAHPTRCASLRVRGHGLFMMCIVIQIGLPIVG